MIRSLARLSAHIQMLPILESGEETLVGGQAVMEGVMMRSPHSYCVAVRKSSGEIVTEENPLARVSEKYPAFKLPVLRGLGTLGKTGNCQIAVSVTVATLTMHVPVDMDLYLPKSWAEDRPRCWAAHIPDDVVYRPKWRIALDLIERNVEAGVPLGLMLTDSAYGDVGEFRDGVRALGFQYAVDVKCHTRVVIVCDDNGAEKDRESGG